MKKENQMIIPEKTIYRLKAIFIKIPMQFFTQIVKKKNLEFHMYIQNTQDSQNNHQQEQ